MPKPIASTFLPVCQAENWFYVYSGKTGEKAIDRIVMWARLLDENNPEGAVVGLVSVRHDPGRTPSLVLPYTSEGCYVHADDLSDSEKKILSRYKSQGG